jgi:subtilisin family serine protease
MSSSANVQEVGTMGFVRAIASVVVFFLLSGMATADDLRVVVGFKGKPDPALLKRHGAKPGRTLASLKAVRAVVPAAAVARLRAEPSVAYVEEDGIAEILGKPSNPGGGKGKDKDSTPPPQETPWGITRVGAPLTGNVGAGIKVAIIDTGLDLDHPDLAANIKGSVDFTGSRKGAEDEHGHGSHVGGTVAALNNEIGVVGAAPGANLYAVRVLDRRGAGWWSDVADGVSWTAAHDMNIANMSLGGSSAPSYVEDACDGAEAAGVLLIAAAGNRGDGNTSTTELGFPAAYASVVAVGATDRYDNLASFSNSGVYLEVSGPGVGVLSTYKKGEYATLSGTSMASPHAAAIATLIWSESGSPTNATVRTELQNRAEDVNGGGRDAGYGFGIVRY